MAIGTIAVAIVSTGDEPFEKILDLPALVAQTCQSTLMKRTLPTAAFVAIALSLGGAVGYFFGSWSACGGSCHFDVNLFSAIGSWVGGVGVSAIVGSYAIYRRRQIRQQDREEARRLAQLCVLRLRPAPSGHGWATVNASFTNNLTEFVTDLSMHIIGGPVLRRDSIIIPGNKWGWTFRPETEWFKTSEGEAKKWIRDHLTDRLVFSFTIREYSFIRSGTNLYFLDEAPKSLRMTPQGP